MQFIYQTERLSLQILNAEQAQTVCDFYCENKDFLEPYEPKRPANFYTASFHASNLSCEYHAFLKLSYIRYWIFAKENPSVPIGSVCFSNFMHGAFQKCMLGYKLGETACHNGYMTEALSFLLPIVMQEFHLHRIEAFVQPDNTSSIRLLSRLGFAEEGDLSSFAQINGIWTDHLLFSYVGSNSDCSVPGSTSIQ
ncbi:MAG: GNAT family N-acetyltransferase [Butyribacter sp.]|nr:GNAT family N-acetyltransferase [bacterium]MDY3854114.1 GNAT family N-acetyltransferase [Butyribacter sp.]